MRLLHPHTSRGAGGRRGVTVLSGFLGSGKTTLLRAELRRLGADGPTVILNDFGHTPVDDVLLAAGRDAPTVISGGCACCTRRDELAGVLRQLIDAEHRGASPATDHVVIETSGLSDPGPIAFTLNDDPVLRHHYELTRICVAVDAVTGMSTLEDHDVAQRQLLAADDLFLTKSDLVQPAVVEELVSRLRELNPSSRIAVTAAGHVVRDEGPGDAAPRRGDDWTAGADAHLAEVTTVELVTDAPLEWQAFVIWLTLLLHRYGTAVLRVKGVLDVEDVGPVGLNGVQHVIHEPQHLTEPVPVGTRLVLILQGLDPELVRRSFFVMQELDRSEQRQS